MQNFTSSIFDFFGKIDFDLCGLGQLKKRPMLLCDVGAITKEDEESPEIKSAASSVLTEKTFISAKTT